MQLGQHAAGFDRPPAGARGYPRRWRGGGTAASLERTETQMLFSMAAGTAGNGSERYGIYLPFELAAGRDINVVAGGSTRRGPHGGDASTNSGPRQSAASRC